MPVYKRERKTTATQYIATAQKLQVEILNYCMNEKRFSKKYRYILVQDIINKSNEFADNVVGSNAIFPNTEEKVALRKRYLERAIVNCYQLENKFLLACRTIESVTPDNLKNITSLLFDELILLKNTLKSVKLINGEKV